MVCKITKKAIHKSEMLYTKRSSKRKAVKNKNYKEPAYKRWGCNKRYENESGVKREKRGERKRGEDMRTAKRLQGCESTGSSPATAPSLVRMRLNVSYCKVQHMVKEGSLGRGYANVLVRNLVERFTMFPQFERKIEEPRLPHSSILLDQCFDALRNGKEKGKPCKAAGWSGELPKSYQ
ncbi:hypothetical protein AMTR_s00055p00047040 [Amborella trichopoda]|uniref:Uncharacterized protein n=1 Tax=Amborella trichopoda TaxID=13333 RepID=U5D6Z0_AMBTC|nr:hypothetical protein AMTR_s00055p00047040 [Amborella trichopoda]